MKDIKELREERGMSQNQLAEASGLTQAAISYIEKNSPNISLYTLTQLAKGLGVPVEYLLDD